MKRTPDLPALNTAVHAYNVRLVRHHYVDGRRIVAEADLLSSGDALSGLIPLDQISPYEDLDPAALQHSRSFLDRLCWALLLESDYRFEVIGHARLNRSVILSQRQLRLRETTIANRKDTPEYEAHGFRSIANLHFHLLKHPLGLGGDDADWPALLAYPNDAKQMLSRLKAVECRAAQQYDGRARRLSQNLCKACSLAQKLRCLPVLRSLRKVYEEQAVLCIEEASHETHPRHYHHKENSKRVLVFMDAECCKVVAKGGKDGSVSAATFYQPDDCCPTMPEINIRYFGERRRIANMRAVGAVTVCNAATWELDP